MSNLILGVILAVLNALFIYQSVLKRRIPSYAVLKLLGLKNFQLRAVILLEMLLLFSCSFIGQLIYNLRYSIGYSFGLLLLIYVLLSLIMTIRLVKKQPFEAYSANK